MKTLIIITLMVVVIGLPLLAYVIGQNNAAPVLEHLARTCAALSILAVLMYLSARKSATQGGALGYVVYLLVAESFGVALALWGLVITVYFDTFSLGGGTFTNQLLLALAGTMLSITVLGLAQRQENMTPDIGRVSAGVASATVTFGVMFNLYYQQLHS